VQSTHSGCDIGVREDRIECKFAARLGELAIWLEDAGDKLMVESPSRIKDSATGFSGILCASAHTAAPCLEEGGRVESFELGDRVDGPPGSGSEDVRKSCCLAVRDDIVGSSSKS
jgi:hypothetical protein